MRKNTEISPLPQHGGGGRKVVGEDGGNVGGGGEAFRRLHGQMSTLNDRLEKVEKENMQKNEKIDFLTETINKMAKKLEKYDEGRKVLEKAIADMRSPQQGEDLQVLTVKCQEIKKEISELNAQQKETARSFAEAVKSNHTIKQVVKEVALENIGTNDFRDTVMGMVKDEIIEQASPLIKATYDRQRSVIVSGVKESRKETRDERQKDDMDKIVAVLNKIGVTNEGNNIAHMYRLGKFSETKARLIKVIFEREEIQKKAMSLARNLKECEEYKKVFIWRDRTKDEQDKIKVNLQEAKTRNDERNEREKKDFYWRAEGLKGVRRVYLRDMNET